MLEISLLKNTLKGFSVRYDRHYGRQRFVVDVGTMGNYQLGGCTLIRKCTVSFGTDIKYKRKGKFGR